MPVNTANFGRLPINRDAFMPLGNWLGRTRPMPNRREEETAPLGCSEEAAKEEISVNLAELFL